MLQQKIESFNSNKQIQNLPAEVTRDNEFESLKKEEDQALGLKIGAFSYDKTIIQNNLQQNGDNPDKKQETFNVLTFLIDKERVSEELFVNEIQPFLLSVNANDLLCSINNEEEKKATMDFLTRKCVL